MTKTQSRIKIAEKLGWVWHGDLSWDKSLPYWKRDNYAYHELPNYPEDLNACANMENWLKEKYSCRSVNNHWRSYHIQLWKVVNPDIYFQWDSERWVDCIYATAPQRCEAFLKTLGLWEGMK